MKKKQNLNPTRNTEAVNFKWSPVLYADNSDPIKLGEFFKIKLFSVNGVLWQIVKVH